MKTPPFLLAVGLLFWGWMTGCIWLALPIGLVLEGSRLIRARFDFSQADLDRIWNLCVMLFVGSAVVTFALNDGFDSMGTVLTSSRPAERMEMFNKGAASAVRFLQYMPVTLLPIMLVQAVAAKDRFPWSTFSLWLRRQRRNKSARPEGPGVNLSYPYLAVVLFAASLSGENRLLFTPALAGILVWSLWRNRPRSARWPAAILCLACAVVLGVATDVGLLQVQRAVRHLDAALMAQLSRAGLVTSRREGRSILYATNYRGMNALLTYLTEDCCQGRPEICRTGTVSCDPMGETVAAHTGDSNEAPARFRRR